MIEIFISFNYTYDNKYRNIIKAWNENERIFDFTFDDRTPNEIQTDNIATVKAVLTRKIKEAIAVVIIVGEHANELHPDYKDIGYRNWQNFEIAKAKELNKEIVAVQIDSHYEYPEELKKSGATRVSSFKKDDILEAIMSGS
ncbi:MAG: TIR domain-containing protein [bacterium]|nr:TIR domain-containing protein [bacterium]